MKPVKPERCFFKVLLYCTVYSFSVLPARTLLLTWKSNWQLRRDRHQPVMKESRRRKISVTSSLKVLANENWGGSKLDSIDPFWWTVLLASVFFRAPMDTITRGAETFSASLAHFDNVPTCWVGTISQRPNINVRIFCYSARSAVKNHNSWRREIFLSNQPEAPIVFVIQ